MRAATNRKNEEKIMTDLTKGIVCLNGYDIDPETTVSELLEAFPKAKQIGNGKSFLLLTQVGLLRSENGMFVGRFSCKDGKLRCWSLSPAGVKHPEGEGSKAEEAIQREICDNWLRGYLGEPNVQSGTESIYYLSWGEISVRMSQDPHGYGREISAAYK